MRHRRIAGLGLALVGALVVAGCGNLTVGGFGEVSVTVAGDAPEPATPIAASPGAAHARTTAAAPWPALPSTSIELEGHVEADFMLFLVAENGSALRLGRDLIEVRVEIGRPGEMDAVDRQRVPAGRYTELQIVFVDVRAEVQGLVVDGEPIPEVRVEIEDTSLLVTRPLGLSVPDGGSVQLLVDLNAMAWIQAVHPLLGTVDEAVFGRLVDVVVR